MIRMRKYTLCLIMLLLPHTALAQDTLSSVLSQASKQDMVALEYREIKHIIFLQDPVLVSGRIFLKGENFVLEQLKPERQLMTADKQRFRFLIPEKHVYHSKMISSSMVQKVLQLFKPLMSGDKQALVQVFDTQFIAGDKGWVLYLAPKNIKGSSFSKLKIEGKVSQTAHHALITMTDGSTSEWFFSALPVSEQNTSTMQKLLVESKG